LNTTSDGRGHTQEHVATQAIYINASTFMIDSAFMLQLAVADFNFCTKK
jgi:hypothetical protein